MAAQVEAELPRPHPSSRKDVHCTHVPAMAGCIATSTTSIAVPHPMAVQSSRQQVLDGAATPTAAALDHSWCCVGHLCDTVSWPEGRTLLPATSV